MSKVINIVETSPETAKIDALVERYSTLIVDSVAAGMPLSQTLIYFKKNNPLNTALWSQIEQRVTRNLQLFQQNKIHLNGCIGAPEVLAQNGSKLELRGFKPSFEQLNDYSHLIGVADGTKEYIGDKPLKRALDIICDFSINYGYQVRELANYLKADTPIQSAFNVWYFIKKNIKYEFDTPGQEELRTPARVWADRLTGVDCDDYAIFAAALLIQMGYEPNFKVVQFNNKRGYGHIYVTLDDIVIDACLSRWNEHPQNITKSMDIYTLKGACPLKGVCNDDNLGDVAQITQGAFGAVSAIGAAVPPPVGTIMGVLGGIGSAIASLFRGKPEMDPKEYEQKFNEFVLKANELASNINNNTLPSVITSVHGAISVLETELIEGTQKLREEYNIPTEFLNSMKVKIRQPAMKFDEIRKFQLDRDNRNMEAFLMAASLYAKGDKSQESNIKQLWKSMYIYSPNRTINHVFDDRIINYDPSNKVVDGRGGVSSTYNQPYTKEIASIMQKAEAEVLAEQPKSLLVEPQPTTTPTTGGMMNKAGMGSGMMWALAAAGAFAGYKLLVKK